MATNPLTDLQLAILRVLWRAGEATAAEVHAELLPERGLALSTVATLLARMLRKGLVARSSGAKPWRFRACRSEDEVQRDEAAGAVERAFAGDVAGLICKLLDERKLPKADLARIQALLDAHGRARGKKRRNDDA